MLEIIRQARLHGQRVSTLSGGRTYLYSEVILASEKIASLLLGDQKDLKEDRVAFMVTPGFDYVNVLWGIWQAGGIAVPLCPGHPAPALQHVLKDSGCGTLILSANCAVQVESLSKIMGIQLIVLESAMDSRNVLLPEVNADRRAMILYTSGTTSVPKGVVTTHKNLKAQISTLIKSWRWSQTDHTLCVLPLHHVHGIVNVVSCSQWVGACCEYLTDFDADSVLRVFLEGRVNVFMAVPTIYFKLISAWEALEPVQQSAVSAALKSMRLMVSGSAALPVSVMDKWEKISGHKLLERYGMTELGMAISNPYDGPRKAGKVGLPMEGVEVRLRNDLGMLGENEPAEIQVKGENVFMEYWKQPEATKAAFTSDGWFKTGDMAVVEDGYYRILGRSSVDIIKSGGYKISALEIEEVLRTHPAIKDCAVVGLDDEEWGEVVAAALVTNQKLNFDELGLWLKGLIPAYRIPRKFLEITELPRNAMGKVTKNEVKKLFLGL